LATIGVIIITISSWRQSSGGDVYECMISVALGQLFSQLC